MAQTDFHWPWATGLVLKSINAMLYKISANFLTSNLLILSIN